MKYLPRTKPEAVLDECLIGRRPLTAQNLSTTITLIAEQRMSDVLHVGAYLVGAPCFQPALYQCRIAETLDDPPMGDGRFPDFRVGRKDGHALTVAWVTPDVALYASLVFREMPHTKA